MRLSTPTFLKSIAKPFTSGKVTEKARGFAHSLNGKIKSCVNKCAENPKTMLVVGGVCALASLVAGPVLAPVLTTVSVVCLTMSVYGVCRGTPEQQQNDCSGFDNPNYLVNCGFDNPSYQASEA